MAARDEVAEAILKVAEEKSPQSKLLKKYFDVIDEALDGGASMSEVLKVIKSKTSIHISQDWAYKVMRKERIKRSAKAAQKKKLNEAHPKLEASVESNPTPQNHYLVKPKNPDPAPQGEDEAKVDDEAKDYMKMPFEELPAELKELAWREISEGDFMDIRPTLPPVSKYGHEDEQFSFHENMLKLGFDSSSPEYIEKLKDLRVRGKCIQRYKNYHREFKKVVKDMT